MKILIFIIAISIPLKTFAAEVGDLRVIKNGSEYAIQVWNGNSWGNPTAQIVRQWLNNPATRSLVLQIAQDPNFSISSNETRDYEMAFDERGPLDKLAGIINSKPAPSKPKEDLSEYFNLCRGDSSLITIYDLSDP